MNTKISYALVLLTGLFLTGCANEEKEKSPLEPLIATANVEWTAYKTTDKLPVKGKLKRYAWIISGLEVQWTA